MITFIGDVHNKYSEYLKIAKNTEYSIQLGDFGTRDEYNKLNYSGLDPGKHKIIPGNHDNYDTCPHSPYVLMDYGPATINKLDFFYIRGGLSIDRVYSIGEELSGSPKKYWSQEELNLDEMLDCMDLYRDMKPDVVASHVPPGIFTDFMTAKNNSILQRYKFHHGYQENTMRLGNRLLKIHKPKLWICGHMHANVKKDIDGTIFICLKELGTFNYEQ